ncbi:Uncharacterised protein [Mycobacteroides abscessus subsp. abscessus]|nr:Uncharacterised protein [Mycobacteroides abscessus subsp. abscessus]
MPGEHEVREAHGLVLADQVRDLLVGADQRGARSPADQPGTGPQPGVDLQVPPVPAVQGQHPPLPLGFGGPQGLLLTAHQLLRDRIQHRLGHGPGLLGGVPGDHVQPDPVAQGASARRRGLTHPRDLLPRLGRRLAPGQVHIGQLRGDLQGRRGGPGEVHLRHRVRGIDQTGLLHAHPLGVVVEGRAVLPQPAHDPQVLPRAPVAALLVQEVSVGPLLGGLPAGDHVQGQAPAGLGLEGRGHLRGQRGREGVRTHRDEEAQARGVLGQRGGGQPWVPAVQTRGGQHGVEAVGLRGLGHLAQVGQLGFAHRGAAEHLRAVLAAHDPAGVPAGGQEPVESRLDHVRAPDVPHAGVCAARPPESLPGRGVGDHARSGRARGTSARTREVTRRRAAQDDGCPGLGACGLTSGVRRRPDDVGRGRQRAGPRGRAPRSRQPVRSPWKICSCSARKLRRQEAKSHRARCSPSSSSPWASVRCGW